MFDPRDSQVLKDIRSAIQDTGNWQDGSFGGSRLYYSFASLLARAAGEREIKLLTLKATVGEKLIDFNVVVLFEGLIVRAGVSTDATGDPFKDAEGVSWRPPTVTTWEEIRGVTLTTFRPAGGFSDSSIDFEIHLKDGEKISVTREVQGDPVAAQEAYDSLVDYLAKRHQ